MAEAWAIRRALLETMLETKYKGEYVSRTAVLRLVAMVSECPQGMVTRLSRSQLRLYKSKLQQLELFS